MKEAIKDILKDDEKILSYYESANEHSVYFLFQRKEFEFLPIRISNYGKNSYFSNRSFPIDENINNLVIKIRNYLDNTMWYVFKYEDYFMLRILKILNYKKIVIYIEHSKKTYEKSNRGLSFYQVDIKSKQEEKEYVSDSFQKYLRKLFSHGLINGKANESKDFNIYLTDFARDLIAKYFLVFENKFHFALKQTDINHIEVPLNEEVENQDRL